MAKPRLPRFRLATVAALVLVVFWVATFWIVGQLGLEGWPRYAVLGLLGGLGLALAGTVYWFSAKLAKSKAAPPQTPEADELSSLIANARKRLEAAESSKAPFSEMPLLLILGARGSAKSSLILEGGVHAELLAGNAQGGGTPEPTRTANIWYSDGTIYVEAASAVVASDDLWRILMTAVRPRRLRAYFTRQGQAARAVIICVSTQSIADGRASEALVQLAQNLRTRLFETAQELGVQLPVYVVFTKMDEVPHFTDFVRNFTDEEAQRVLGATLPYQNLNEAANYAASQTARTQSALEGIFRSLALKRLNFLRRESVTQRAAAAYEFPREFRKLQEPVVRFLVELCQPSQLRVSPFLRGVYFIGRRTVDVDATPQIQAAPQDVGSSFGATRIFSPGELTPSMAAPGSPPRRGQQWVFLQRILRDVVLRDRSVLELTTGGSKVTRGRRLVYAGTMAAILLAGLATSVSFIQNRRLQSAVSADVARLAQLPEGPPSMNTLATLDSVRTRVQELADWNDGHPLTYRMGLYQGTALHQSLRPAYFEAFERSLYGAARDSLVQALGNLPAAPNEQTDYLRTYDKLKAYLIVSDTAGASTAEFLAPVLVDHTAGLVGENARSLADSQYVFFARELVSENPFPGSSSDAALVERARAFLGEAGGIDPFFARMVSEASRGRPSEPLGDFAGLRVPSVVPGAFTSAGRAAVNEWLDQPDTLIVQTEEWVVGPGAEVPPAGELREALRSRYGTEYGSLWRRLVLGTSVQPFSSSAEGANRIRQLVDAPSSMGRFVGRVGINQLPDTLESVFNPLRAFLITDDSGSVNQNAGLSEPARNYLTALTALEGALRTLSDAESEGISDAADRVEEQARAARSAAGGLTGAFGMEPENASLRSTLAAMVNDPIQWAEQAANRERRRGPVEELNSTGQAFCRNLTTEVGGKYPFNRSSPDDVAPEDLGRVFQPGQSRIWNLGGNLEAGGHIQRVGDFYEAAGSVTINPAFLTFYGNARRFAESVYPEGSTEPRLGFTLQLRPTAETPNLTFTFDAQPLDCRVGACRSENYAWTASPNRRIELTAEVSGQSYRVAIYRGTWAVFRLFENARGWGSGQRHDLRWPILDDSGEPVMFNGSPAVVQATVTMLGGAHPVFSRNFLDQLACVPRIAN